MKGTDDFLPEEDETSSSEFETISITIGKRYPSFQMEISPQIDFGMCPIEIISTVQVEFNTLQAAGIILKLKLHRNVCCFCTPHKLLVVW